MSSILLYIAIIVALSLFAISEVLIAYRKYQLKKQYVKELDEYEANKKNSGDVENGSEERQSGKEL